MYIQDIDVPNNEGSVTIAHLNIRSLLSKFDEISDLLGQMKLGTTIFGFSETWLDDTVESSMIEINRPGNTRGGGVLVYISDAVKPIPRCDVDNDCIEAIWLQVKWNGTPVLVCDLYRPANAKFNG